MILQWEISFLNNITLGVKVSSGKKQVKENYSKDNESE